MCWYFGPFWSLWRHSWTMRSHPEVACSALSPGRIAAISFAVGRLYCLPSTPGGTASWRQTTEACPWHVPDCKVECRGWLLVNSQECGSWYQVESLDCLQCKQYWLYQDPRLHHRCTFVHKHTCYHHPKRMDNNCYLAYCNDSKTWMGTYLW